MTVRNGIGIDASSNGRSAEKFNGLKSNHKPKIFTKDNGRIKQNVTNFNNTFKYSANFIIFSWISIIHDCSQNKLPQLAQKV